MEMWTNDQFQTCKPTSCVITLNAISSLELEDGRLLCNLQAGQQINQSGQGLVHASRFPAQEKDLETKTNGISGPCSLISSKSAALTQSLASKLRQQLGRDGLMEYKQTWNQKVTPAGRSYWAHTASGHRISDNVFTGWPTPKESDYKNMESVNFGEHLGNKAKLVGWPTPAARDWKDTGNLESSRWRKDGTERKDTLGRVAQEIKGWCSPTATDASRGILPPRPQDTGIPLSQQVAGMITNSPTVETVKPAAFQLNPHFSRWLMGFPPEWCDCAVTAMQSFPSVRRSSLKPTVRPIDAA